MFNDVFDPRFSVMGGQLDFPIRHKTREVRGRDNPNRNWKPREVPKFDCCTSNIAPTEHVAINHLTQVRQNRLVVSVMLSVVALVIALLEQHNLAT